MPTETRTWRLHRSLGELLRRGRCTGIVLRVVVGHVVHLFMLLRPALAALDRACRFINKYGPLLGVFDTYLIAELKVIRGLPAAGGRGPWPAMI